MLRDTNEAQEIGSEKEIDVILDVLEKHCTADCFFKVKTTFGDMQAIYLPDINPYLGLGRGQAFT